MSFETVSSATLALVILGAPGFAGGPPSAFGQEFQSADSPSAAVLAYFEAGREADSPTKILPYLSEGARRALEEKLGDDLEDAEIEIAVFGETETVMFLEYLKADLPAPEATVVEEEVRGDSAIVRLQEAAEDPGLTPDATEDPVPMVREATAVLVREAGAWKFARLSWGWAAQGEVR